jgi:phospholipid/cholesterol/gamma-HCH transport system substrate-binding protein
MESSAKVGALVLAFVLLGGWALFFLGEGAFRTETEAYYVEFPDAGGLAPGAVVMMRGVPIGSVESVNLETSAAVAKLALKPNVNVPTGTVGLLRSSLISLGDQELLLVPGAGTSRLSPGSTILGSKESALETMLPGAQDTLQELSGTLAAMRELLQDPALKGGTTKALASAEGLMNEGQVTARKFGNLAGSLDGSLKGLEGRLGPLMASAESTFKSTEKLMASVESVLSKGEFEGKTLALLDELTAAATEGRRLVAEMNSLAADPELRGAMTRTLDNVEEASKSGAGMAQKLDAAAAEGQRAAQELTALLKRANSLADGVQDLIDRVNGAVGGFGAAAQGAGSLQPDIKVAQSNLEGRLRTDISTMIPAGQEKLELGLFDAFERNQLIAQFHRPMDESLVLRYGIFASEPGLGVDYAVASRAGFRADLFGLNNTRLDASFRYDFGRGVTGWVGLERIFDRNAAMFGIGLKR